MFDPLRHQPESFVIRLHVFLPERDDAGDLFSGSICEPAVTQATRYVDDVPLQAAEELPGRSGGTQRFETAFAFLPGKDQWGGPSVIHDSEIRATVLKLSCARSSWTPSLSKAFAVRSCSKYRRCVAGANRLRFASAASIPCAMASPVESTPAGGSVGA